MIKLRVALFLVLAFVFASVHYLAMAASLYWYFWWFDIVMHFWGGLMIGFGVHSLTTFSFIPFKPTLKLVLLVTFIATFSWEVFEWFAGLYDPTTYFVDTSMDIVLGFSGGLLAHGILSTLYNREI